MHLGHFFVLLALLSFATMGIFHKLADRYNATPLNITVMTMLSALGLSWGRVGITAHGDWSVPWMVVGIALGFGVSASAGFWFFQTGLRYGRIATSWLVINLSAAVPTVLSILVYKEMLTLRRAMAFGLVVVSLLLMWWDRYQDEGKEVHLGQEGE
jgi:drug/metabolite transporter (DMT)-like permease